MIEIFGKQKQKGYKYLQSIGIEFKKQRRLKVKKKFTFNQLHNKTQTLGRYAQKLEITKQSQSNKSDIISCNINSEYRSLSNNYQKKSNSKHYYNNSILVNSKILTKNNNSSSLHIINSTNHNFINSQNRKQFNITTYKKVHTSGGLSMRKFYPQFHPINKIRFNRQQQQAIKILKSPNNGIIFNPKKGQSTKSKYIQNSNYTNHHSITDNGQRQSPHFKSIQYSIGRRARTMTLEENQLNNKKGHKFYLQNYQSDLTNCPSSLQLQHELTFQLLTNKKTNF